ncbi:MAG: ExbD/TolR family protein [Polyangiales bacterium]
MGGISVGGGGGKKSVDSEIPLVPFIDLLLCCVMFLLATAVWNKLAQIDANQQTEGTRAPDDAPPPEEEKIRLILQVQDSGYTLASTAGDSLSIDKNGANYDVEELRAKLKQRRRMEPNRTEIIVSPDDGIEYQHVVKAMDLVVGEGFKDMSVADASSLL